MGRARPTHTPREFLGVPPVQAMWVWIADDTVGDAVNYQRKQGGTTIFTDASVASRRQGPRSQSTQAIGTWPIDTQSTLHGAVRFGSVAGTTTTTDVSSSSGVVLLTLPAARAAVVGRVKVSRLPPAGGATRLGCPAKQHDRHHHQPGGGGGRLRTALRGHI